MPILPTDSTTERGYMQIQLWQATVGSYLFLALIFLTYHKVINLNVICYSELSKDGDKSSNDNTQR